MINPTITQEEALIIIGKIEVEKFCLMKERDAALQMVTELNKRLQALQPKDKE